MCQTGLLVRLSRLRIGQGRSQHCLHGHGQQFGHLERLSHGQAGRVSFALLDGAVGHLQVFL